MSLAAVAALSSPLSICLMILGCFINAAVTLSSMPFLAITLLFSSKTPAIAVLANEPKFINSLPIPIVKMASPGPEIKEPIPLSKSFPIPFPNSSNIPPSSKAPIALFTRPNIFSIAGFNVASPIPAPAFVKLTKVLFARASRVSFNFSFFL